MDENINEFINEVASDRASDAFFTDCKIIRYLLENVEAVVVKTIQDLEQCITIVKDNRKNLR